MAEATLPTLPFPHISNTLPAEEKAGLRTVPFAEVPEWARVRGEEYKRRIQEIEEEYMRRTKEVQEELRRRIREIQEEPKRQVKELEEHLATFHTLQNTGAPVSRLPNEVLGEIFAATVCSLRERKLPHRSIGVVCRRWKDVLLSTPTFWAKSISATQIYTSTLQCLNEGLSTVLPLAIRYSGSVPISISISDTSGIVMSVLNKCAGRIAKMRLHDLRFMSACQDLMNSGRMTSLHSVSISYPRQDHLDITLALDGDMLPALHFLHIDSITLTPQMVVGSLETLELFHLPLRLHTFHAVLERCSRLRVLHLYVISIPDEELNDTTHECGPQFALQKLFIRFSPSAIRPLLLYFSTAICAGRIGLVHVSPLSRFHSAPEVLVWNYHTGGVSNPFCIFDRLCIRKLEVMTYDFSGYAGSAERLRVDTFKDEILLPIPFRVPTISTVVFDCQSAFGEGEVDELIETFPHVRRIELPSRTAEAGTLYATSFLRLHAEIAGELSIAWVLGIHPGEEWRARAADDLEGLLELLRAHMQMDGGKPRLGRLDLYAGRVSSDFEPKPYAGRIDERTDAVLCREVVGPFLSRFEEVVDVVVLG